jgi:D-sedoheptulose 7-phosphate isomerase
MSAADHVDALVGCLRDDGRRAAERVAGWGALLAAALIGGGRLLAAGNGGSAAQAQHLTAELVGRYCDERQAFSAICLSAETSTLTAIVNDYGAEDLFARQVRAHGRAGDVLVCLSTSGRSPNVVAAAAAARDRGIRAWGLTGPGPNPLLGIVDEGIAVHAPAAATVQEAHLMLVHVLCEAFDDALASA